MILPPWVMLMFVGSAMMMVMVVTQQEGSKNIDEQSEYCNRNSFIKGSWHRIKKSVQALVADQ